MANAGSREHSGYWLDPILLFKHVKLVACMPHLFGPLASEFDMLALTDQTDWRDLLKPPVHSEPAAGKLSQRPEAVSQSLRKAKCRRGGAHFCKPNREV